MLESTFELRTVLKNGRQHGHLIHYSTTRQIATMHYTKHNSFFILFCDIKPAPQFPDPTMIY